MSAKINPADALPEELVWEIIDYLSIDDLIALVRVSRKYREIAGEKLAIRVCRIYLRLTLGAMHELSAAIDRCDQIAPNRNQQAGPSATKLIARHVDGTMLRNLRRVFRYYINIVQNLDEQYASCRLLLKRCRVANRGLIRIYLLLRRNLMRRGIRVRGFTAPTN